MISIVRTRPTFALLVLELCRRAAGNASLPECTGDTLAALDELAASDYPECRPLRQVLAAALDAYRRLEAEGRALDLLVPGTIINLDAVLAAVAQGRMQREEMQPALRRAFIRPRASPAARR